MRLNHRKRTGRAVAHVAPVRLSTFAIREGSARENCTTFLYQHLDGGFVFGHTEVDLRTPGGTIAIGQRLPLGSVPASEAFARFSAYEEGRRAALRHIGKQLVESVEVVPLTVEQELALVNRWIAPAARPANWTRALRGVWASDVPAASRLFQQLLTAGLSALHVVVDVHAASADLSRLARWLEPVVLTDARLWAYLLLQASEAVQDGVPDVLQVWGDQGADGLCELLSDQTMDFLASQLTVATRGVLQERVFRFTVADLISEQMTSAVRTLREEWKSTPFKPSLVAAP